MVRSPEHYEGCPEGYHSVEDDDTGQCYSNDDGCPEGTVMTNEKDNCIDENTYENFSNARESVDKETHCNLYPDSEYCQPQLVGSRCRSH